RFRTPSGVPPLSQDRFSPVSPCTVKNNSSPRCSLLYNKKRLQCDPTATVELDYPIRVQFSLAIELPVWLFFRLEIGTSGFNRWIEQRSLDDCQKGGVHRALLGSLFGCVQCFGCKSGSWAGKCICRK